MQPGAVKSRSVGGSEGWIHGVEIRHAQEADRDVPF